MAEDRQIEIERAVTILRGGGLEAFPTDTAHGLGADAENEGAIRKVFAVKGRHESHPLIVHLYAALRRIDRMKFDAVVATLPSGEGLGLAIRDRLRRAAGLSQAADPRAIPSTGGVAP